MKHNYIDGKGNYHNELNVTLAQIYDSGVEFGCEVTAEGIVEELKKIKEEMNVLYDVYEPYFKERLVIKTDVIQIIDKHISELKGENK